VAFIFQVVTDAVETSRFEGAVISFVPIFWAVFGSVHFVFVLFEFYFTTLYVFYVEYVFVIPGRF
jgi:hypothetical protein